LHGKLQAEAGWNTGLVRNGRVHAPRQEAEAGIAWLEVQGPAVPKSGVQAPYALLVCYGQHKLGLLHEGLLVGLEGSERLGGVEAAG
jgi:hypothetical protein